MSEHQYKDGPNDYYSADEVAAMLSANRVTVYRMGARGDLPRIKIGGLVRFPAQQINELLGRRADGAA